MSTFDFSPLFRSSVGFDRMARLMDSASRLEPGSTGYPPYNIFRDGEDEYGITLAVAGFTEDELTLVSERNVLTVSGKQAEHDSDREFLHRGIATRAFERRFQLADHVRVTGADLANGLLHIKLQREVPEAMKPQTIAIGNSNVRTLDVEAVESKGDKVA